MSLSYPFSARSSVPNLADETLNWLPYGNSSIPRVEPYCWVWLGRGGGWGVGVRGTGQRSVCVCVGEDLGSFTGLLLAGLISLICRQSGPQLRAQGLKACDSRKTRRDSSSHSRTCITSSHPGLQLHRHFFFFKRKGGKPLFPSLSLSRGAKRTRQWKEEGGRKAAGRGH